MTTQLDPRRWWILAVIGFAQTLVVLDATVMNIALPAAQRDLGFSDASRPWILTAYTLAFGSLLLLSGRLGDRFGRRAVFLAGLVGFAVFSAIAGAAGSFGLLVTARAGQGVFAALLAPSALALLTTTFTSGRERGRAFGVFGAIGVAGSTVGLLLGGALTEYFSWRWTMYINVVLAIPPIIGALLLLARADQREPVRFDVPGTLTVSGGLFALVYGFSQVAEDGWGAPATVGLLLTGVALLALFVLLQSRSAAPLLPLRILADRQRAAALLTMLIGTAGLLAVVFFMAFYVQGVLGWSPVRTGVAFLPQPLALVLAAAVLGPRINRRLGPRVVTPVGMFLAAGAVFLLTRLGVDSSYGTEILPSLVLMGVGLGLSFPTSTSNATQGIAAQDTGVGSALVGTVQQVGGSVGVAILNSVATNAARHAGAGGPLAATVHGLNVASWWAGVFFLIGGVVAAVMFRSGVPADVREAQLDRVAVPA